MMPEQAAALRKPFAPEQIGKLPKLWCRDCTDANKRQRGTTCEKHRKVKCDVCHNNISDAHVDLDYVGHAATTDRLLQVDPAWTWEPVAFDADGAPLVLVGVRDAVMWIRLTVCGVTRLGVGIAPKGAFELEKQLISDCVVRGTLVPTTRGVLPVEDIVIGDLTMTRSGWRRVTDHWLSHEMSPVVSAMLSDGSTLSGTAHHPVYARGRGFVHLGALRNGDILFAWSDLRKRPLRSWFLRVSRIGATETVGTTWDGTARARSRSIAPFTNRRTARSHAVGTSTMSIAIPTTIGRRIWSRSLRKITRGNTRTTTGVRTAPANGAASSITPADVTARAGAPTRARNEPAGRQAWTASNGPAKSAATYTQLSAKRRRGHAARRVPNGFVTAAIEPATNAAPYSSRNASGHDSVALSVVSVRDAGHAEVWNLTVADRNEFFADGVLTHNSLRNAAMRFGVALDLWAKEDLQGESSGAEQPSGGVRPAAQPAPPSGPPVSANKVQQLTSRAHALHAAGVPVTDLRIARSLPTIAKSVAHELDAWDALLSELEAEEAAASAPFTEATT